MSKEKTKAIKKKASRRQKKDWIAAYIFIAPVTIGLLIFYVWPFIQNFWFSFNDVNKFNMATFCGLDNYKKLFEEPDLMLALKNTILYAVYHSSDWIVYILTSGYAFEFQNQRKRNLQDNLFPAVYHNGGSGCPCMEINL